MLRSVLDTAFDAYVFSPSPLRDTRTAWPSGGVLHTKGNISATCLSADIRMCRMMRHDSIACKARCILIIRERGHRGEIAYTVRRTVYEPAGVVYRMPTFATETAKM